VKNANRCTNFCGGTPYEVGTKRRNYVPEFAKIFMIN